VIARYPRPKE